MGVHNDSDAREKRFCDEMAKFAQMKREIEAAKRKLAERTGEETSSEKTHAQGNTKARRPITKG